jgi:hypothetical protein
MVIPFYGSNEFPKTLYIYEPTDHDQQWLEAHPHVKGLEEDDTVAIYMLHKVCRVKKKTLIQLRDETDMEKVIIEVPGD